MPTYPGCARIMRAQALDEGLRDPLEADRERPENRRTGGLNASERAAAFRPEGQRDEDERDEHEYSQHETAPEGTSAA